MDEFKLAITSAPPHVFRTLHDEYEAVARRRLNTIPLMRVIGNQIHQIIKETFISQGRRGGGSWAKLSESTMRRKMGYSGTGIYPLFGGGWSVRKKYGGGFERGRSDPRILFRSHDMYKSLTSLKAEGAIVDPKQDFVIIGTKFGYAKYHRTGTMDMPARDWWKPTSGDRKRMAEETNLFFLRAKAQFGGSQARYTKYRGSRR